MRVKLVFAREDVHDLVFGKAGKALVHPVVALLVGSKHAIKPHVRALVGNDAEGSEVAVSVRFHEGRHGVLHGPFSALDHAELGPEIGSEALVHEGEVGRDVGPKALVLVHHC